MLVASLMTGLWPLSGFVSSEKPLGLQRATGLSLKRFEHTKRNVLSRHAVPSKEDQNKPGKVHTPSSFLIV